MAYHDDLLEAAGDLLLVPQSQATLRRAVSTAYYAVFHLLIHESCQLWIQPEHRQSLARQYDHAQMKVASRQIYETKFKTPVTPAEKSLVTVAENFVELQQLRHNCDYDLRFTLSFKDAADMVEQASASFDEWAKIRNERIATDYLYALLFKENRR
jgi:hypothetical protein